MFSFNNGMILFDYVESGGYGNTTEKNWEGIKYVNKIILFCLRNWHRDGGKEMSMIIILSF